MLQAHVGIFGPTAEIVQSNGYSWFQPIKLIAKHFIDAHILLHSHVLYKEDTSAYPLGPQEKITGF